MTLLWETVQALLADMRVREAPEVGLQEGHCSATCVVIPSVQGPLERPFGPAECQQGCCDTSERSHRAPNS